MVSQLVARRMVATEVMLAFGICVYVFISDWASSATAAGNIQDGILDTSIDDRVPQCALRLSTHRIQAFSATATSHSRDEECTSYMSLCSLSIHPRSTAFESTLSVHQSSSMSLPFDPETYLKWNLGIIFSGLGITGAIFGLSCAQLGVYLRNYWGHDRSLLRAVVSVVWMLDLLHLGLYSYTIYHYLVFKHHDFIGQLVLPWTSNAQMVINTTLVAVVQLFYVLRISSVCNHIAVTGILLFIVAANWAVAILLMVKSTLATSVAALSDLGKFVVASSSLLASSDIIVTLTLVFFLITARTTGSRSKRLIHRLIFYTINTGCMTSICALLALITRLTNGSTNLYILFSYLGASLYTVSMIASLNAREGLRNHMAQAPGITTIPQITTLRREGESTVLEMQRSRKHELRLPPAVLIETSVETTHH